MKNGLRATGWVTLFCFLATHTGWAEGARPFSLPKTLQTSPSDEPESIAARGFFDSLELPESIGRIKTVFRGSRNRILVHIQDAHVNEEAQRNIGKILEFFIRNHKLRLVALEGAQGELDTRLFSFLPDIETRRNIADYYLRAGRLSGSEHLAIVRHPELLLYGIEDERHYRENRAAYLAALDFKARDEEVLGALEKALAGVSRFVFSEKLRELFRRRRHFEDQEGGFIAYARFLSREGKRLGLSRKKYPRLGSLLSLAALEKKIDFEKAQGEIEKASAELKRRLPPARLARFLFNSVQYQTERMTRAAYFHDLEEEIRTLEDPARYTNVLSYLRYRRLSDSPDPALFDELENLEKEVKRKLFRSSEEANLAELWDLFKICRKIFEFSLAPQDADFFLSHRGRFRASTFRSFLKPLLEKYQFREGLPDQLEILDEDLARVERFYSAALARDRILIEKAVRKMRSEDAGIAAIVTGGFHTPGMMRYLKAHDYSYVVVTPQISKESDRKAEARLYEQALRNTPAPLERALLESYYPPKSAALNDPRFQLAAQLMIPTRSETRALLLNIKPSPEVAKQAVARAALQLMLAGFFIRFKGKGGSRIRDAIRENYPDVAEQKAFFQRAEPFTRASYYSISGGKLRQSRSEFLVMPPRKEGRYPVYGVLPQSRRSEVRAALGIYGSLERIPLPDGSEMFFAPAVEKIFIENLAGRSKKSELRETVSGEATLLKMEKYFFEIHPEDAEEGNSGQAETGILRSRKMKKFLRKFLNQAYQDLGAPDAKSQKKHPVLVRFVEIRLANGKRKFEYKFIVEIPGQGRRSALYEWNPPDSGGEPYTLPLNFLDTALMTARLGSGLKPYGLRNILRDFGGGDLQEREIARHGTLRAALDKKSRVEDGRFIFDLRVQKKDALKSGENRNQPAVLRVGIRESRGDQSELFEEEKFGSGVLHFTWKHKQYDLVILSSQRPEVKKEDGRPENTVPEKAGSDVVTVNVPPEESNLPLPSVPSFPVLNEREQTDLERVGLLTEQRRQLEKEIGDSLAQLRRIRSQLEEAQIQAEKLPGLKDQVVKMEDQLTQKRKELESLSGERRRLEAEVQDYPPQLQAAQKKLESVKDQETKLTEQMKELQTRAEALKAVLVELEGTQRTLEFVNRRLLEENSQLEAANTALRQSGAVELEEVNRSVAGVRGRRDQLENEIGASTDKLRSVNTKVERLHADMLALQTSMDQLKREEPVLHARVGDLREERDALTQEREKLKGEIARAQAELEEARAQAQEAEAQVGRFPGLQQELTGLSAPPAETQAVAETDHDTPAVRKPGRFAELIQKHRAKIDKLKEGRKAHQNPGLSGKIENWELESLGPSAKTEVEIKTAPQKERAKRASWRPARLSIFLAASLVGFGVTLASIRNAGFLSEKLPETGSEKPVQTAQDQSAEKPSQEPEEIKQQRKILEDAEKQTQAKIEPPQKPAGQGSSDLGEKKNLQEPLGQSTSAQEVESPGSPAPVRTQREDSTVTAQAGKGLEGIPFMNAEEIREGLRAAKHWKYSGMSGYALTTLQALQKRQVPEITLEDFQEVFDSGHTILIDNALRAVLAQKHLQVSYPFIKKYLLNIDSRWSAIDLVLGKKIAVPLVDLQKLGAKAPAGKTHLWELESPSEIVEASLSMSQNFAREIAARQSPLAGHQTEPAGVYHALLSGALLNYVKENSAARGNIPYGLEDIEMPLLHLLERYPDYLKTLSAGRQLDFAERAAGVLLEERNARKDDILLSPEYRVIIAAGSDDAIGDEQKLRRIFKNFPVRSLDFFKGTEDPAQMQKIKPAYLGALSSVSGNRQPAFIVKSMHGLPMTEEFARSVHMAADEEAQALVEGQAGSEFIELGHIVYLAAPCYGSDRTIELLKGAIRKLAGNKKIKSYPTFVALASRNSEAGYVPQGHILGIFGKLFERHPGPALQMSDVFEMARQSRRQGDEKFTVHRQQPGIFVSLEDPEAIEEKLGIPREFRKEKLLPFLEIGKKALQADLQRLLVLQKFSHRAGSAARSELRDRIHRVFYERLIDILPADSAALDSLETSPLGPPLLGLAEAAEQAHVLLDENPEDKGRELQVFYDAVVQLKSAATPELLLEFFSPDAAGSIEQGLSDLLQKFGEPETASPDLTDSESKNSAPWESDRLLKSSQKITRGKVTALLLLLFLFLFFPFKFSDSAKETEPLRKGKNERIEKEAAPSFLSVSEIQKYLNRAGGFLARAQSVIFGSFAPREGAKIDLSQTPAPAPAPADRQTAKLQRPQAEQRIEPPLDRRQSHPEFPHAEPPPPGVSKELKQNEAGDVIKTVLLDDKKFVVRKRGEKMSYELWLPSIKNSAGSSHEYLGTISDPEGISPHYGHYGIHLDYFIRHIRNGLQDEYELWEVPKPRNGFEEKYQGLPMRRLGRLGPFSRSEVRGKKGVALTALLGGLAGGALALSVGKFLQPPAQVAKENPPAEIKKPGAGGEGDSRKLAEELRKLREQVKKLEDQAPKPPEAAPENIYPSPAPLGKPGLVAPSYRAEEAVPDPAAAKFDFKIKEVKIPDPQNPKNLVEARWSLLVHERPALLLEGNLSHPAALKQIQELQEYWEKLGPLGLQVALVDRSGIAKEALDRWITGNKIDIPVIFDSSPAKFKNQEPFRLYYAKQGRLNLLRGAPSWSYILGYLQKPRPQDAEDRTAKRIWNGSRPLALTGLTEGIHAHLLEELTADQLSWMLHNDPRNKQAEYLFSSDVFKVVHVKDFSPEERAKIDFVEFNLIREKLKKILPLLGQPLDGEGDENDLYLLDWYHYFFKPYFILHQVSGEGAERFMNVLKDVIPFHLETVYPSLGIKSDDDLLPYRAETAEYLLRHPGNPEIWRRLEASWTKHRTERKFPFSLSLRYVLGDAMEAVPEAAALLQLAGVQDLRFLSQAGQSGILLPMTVRNKLFESGLLGKNAWAHKGVLFGAMPLPDSERRKRIIEFFVGNFSGLGNPAQPLPVLSGRPNGGATTHGKSSGASPSQNNGTAGGPGFLDLVKPNRNSRGLGGLHRHLLFSLNRKQKAEAMGILEKAAYDLSAKPDLKYEDFQNVLKELKGKGFISDLISFGLLERAQISQLAGSPFLASPAILWPWYQVFAPEANPFDFSSMPQEFSYIFSEPFPVFPGSFAYTFRNLLGASSAGSAPSQLASSFAIIGDNLRIAFAKMPFDVLLRFRASSTSVFDPEVYFRSNYQEPRFAELRGMDFTSYSQLTYRLNLTRFSNEARIGDFNARFSTLSPFSGAEARITSALLIFYLEHSELWENPNARNLGEIFGSGKGIADLVQIFRKLHDAKIYQRLMGPELGSFLTDDFLERLLNGSLGEVIEQEHQLGLALSGGAYIDRLRFELHEHLKTFAFDQGQGLLLPWISDKWPLPRPANVAHFDETPFRRGAVATVATMAMFNSYLTVLLQEQLNSVYASGILKPDSKPEEIIKFLETKIAIRDMAGIFFYGDKTKLLLANRADRDRLTALTADAHRRGIPPDRYNHILAIASNPEVRAEALSLLKLLTGETARGGFELTSDDQDTAGLHRNFLIWWAGQRKNAEDAKSWAELLKKIASPALQKDFLKWDNARRSQFLQLLAEIGKNGRDKLKDVPEIFAPYLKKSQALKEHPEIPRMKKRQSQAQAAQADFRRRQVAAFNRAVESSPARRKGAILRKSQSRSELREALQETAEIRRGISSTEIQKYFSRISGLDSHFANAFSAPEVRRELERRTGIRLPNPAEENLSGYVLFNYDPKIHDLNLMKAIARQVEQFHGIKVALFGNPGELFTLRRELKSDAQYFEAPEESAAQFLNIAKSTLGITVEHLNQVFHLETGARPEEKDSGRAALIAIAAVSLSQGVVVMINFSALEPQARTITAYDLASSLLAVRRQIEHSA